MLPNTNGCSGSLEIKIKKTLRIYAVSRIVNVDVVRVGVCPDSSNGADDGSDNGGREKPRLDLLPHVAQVSAGGNLAYQVYCVALVIVP